MWPRAAEIIRYTGAGWAASDVDRFETMLRNVYLPEVINGSNSNGNWELSMMEAAVGIAVFLDDRNAYASARQRFLVRVPAFIYLTSDGSVPRTVPGTGRDTPDEIFALLAQPAHAGQRPGAGDLPRLRPHGLRHLGDLARRRDRRDPG